MIEENFPFHSFRIVGVFCVVTSFFLSYTLRRRKECGGRRGGETAAAASATTTFTHLFDCYANARDETCVKCVVENEDQNEGQKDDESSIVEATKTPKMVAAGPNLFRTQLHFIPILVSVFVRIAYFLAL